jgi:hypothetical protein
MKTGEEIWSKIEVNNEKYIEEVSWDETLEKCASVNLFRPGIRCLQSLISK